MTTVATPSLDDEPVPDNELRSTPYLFVADTNSVPYLIDTADNRVIVNNIKLLYTFKAIHSGVKGVGGTSVSVHGIGSLSLPLQSDAGVVDSVCIHDAVYVPSSPFNLLPPQILISQLKLQGYNVPHRFQHDESRYIMRYTTPSGVPS